MYHLTKKWLRMLALAAFTAALAFPAVPTGNAHAKQYATYDHLQLLHAINDNRGKVVMVNFFASWCQPCKLELPALIRLRKDFDGANLTILGLSIDEDAQALSVFDKQMGINYPVHRAGVMAQRVFQVTSIPTTLVYDRAGRLVLAHQGLLSYDALHGTLKTLVEQK